MDHCRLCEGSHAPGNHNSRRHAAAVGRRRPEMVPSADHGRFLRLFYVVIEGYRELRLKDEAIDALLGANNYEARLRRFRNAVFHYQEDPFDKRLIEFLDAEDSEHWGKALYEAFEKFFEKVLPIRQIVERLRSPEADKA
ncbi:hypothetical protein TSA1_26560 [Bradyrhizobium nitroreducens]|uniref:HEPN domain-containing protein n=1 Tax=Bradyrhizobium nitroreducens TaxID=709803 RepID=A0A2M6UNX4_9BRAD|nr:hypothetical protein TSA1_26560 [Bradyrhizobium nitroreducens]